MDYQVREEFSLTKAMYGWSKYGGSNQGLVKEGGGWYCQACGKEQPKEFPAYMMCLDHDTFRNFIRLCADCEHLVKSRHITEYEKLRRIVRKSDYQWLKFERIFKIGLENPPTKKISY